MNKLVDFFCISRGLGTIEDIGHVNFSPGRPSKCLPQKTLSNGATAIEDPSNISFSPSIKRAASSSGQSVLVGKSFTWGAATAAMTVVNAVSWGSSPLLHPTRRVHQYQVKMHLELPHLQKIYGSLKVSAHLAVIGESNFRETLHFRVNLKERRQYQTFLLTSNEAVGKVRTAGALFQIPQARS
ncbi:hypothetical protein TNIN_412401 [Trichonephila inaurata madagascariensis]|uniref:Uncharacterized protein n=1 Tax=Trichonephila inaurata madagascariensis TaxID=2747483 RepID=A0A8X7CT39_9ARAC|nr:hypothetical protein TNIN_412401 [Trichonephila inaurata madagascariensis]